MGFTWSGISCPTKSSPQHYTNERKKNVQLPPTLNTDKYQCVGSLLSWPFEFMTVVCILITLSLGPFIL